MRSLLFVVGVMGCAGPAAAPAGKPQHIDAGDPQLWVQVKGQGEPTIVFEAGEGDDSSVWARTEAEVRLPNGVRTVLYDRAGLGRSAPSSAPYRIDDEANALKRALDRFGIKGPVVLVAHSYGGFVATLVAASDKRVAGVVLVDGYLKEQFDDAAASRLLASYTPQIDALARTRPAVADVMRPLIRAFPDTARRMRGVTYPMTLPT